MPVASDRTVTDRAARPSPMEMTLAFARAVVTGATTTRVAPPPNPRRPSAAGATGASNETEASRLTDKLWEQLSAHVYVFLHQTRLSDIVGDQMAPCPAVPAFVDVVDE